MSAATEEKSHAPTRQRLRLARKRGEVARSGEVTSTLVLVALLALFALAGTFLWEHVQTAAALPLEYFEQRRADEDVVAWASERGFMALLQILGPVTLVTLVGALLGAFVQVRALFSLDPIKPKMERVNPALGMKRMFATRNLIELVKMTVKIALLAILVYALLRSVIAESAKAAHLNPAAIAAYGAVLLGKLLVWAAVIFAAMAAVDYAHQRFEFMKRQRMSREDLRREMREDEGEPLLKSRRRGLAREMATRDLDQEVRNASVVVVGTRTAVALYYQSNAKTLPRLVAKGMGAAAEHIRSVAVQCAVPIHRDDALAQRLFKSTPAGEFIASALFEPVAHLLATLRRYGGR